jgi:Protein of unknown function (DUF3618)
MDDRTTRVGGDDDSTSSGTTRRPRAARGSAASGTAGKTKRASGDETPLDPETALRARELEVEIAETREDLSETVEAIQEKLRPSNIISEGKDAVKTVATERVRNMADNASYTAQNLMETTRENKWPALLIGAGLTWLLIDRAREGREYDNRRYQSAGSRISRARGYQARRNQYDPDYSAGGRTEGEMDYRTADWPSEGRYGMYDRARSAQSGLSRMLHENPLLVAAAAVLAGAAVGGALPQSEKENELMGEARDRMVDRAQGVAREAADSVRDVASAVQQVASQVTDPNQRNSDVRRP